jgi:hypothetical protein
MPATDIYMCSLIHVLIVRRQMDESPEMPWSFLDIAGALLPTYANQQKQKASISRRLGIIPMLSVIVAD